MQNLPDPHGPEPVPSGPISSSRPTRYSTAAIELMDCQNFDLWHTSGCLMADVPCLDHLWDGQKDCLDVGQVRCFHEETSRKTTFLEGRYKGE